MCYVEYTFYLEVFFDSRLIFFSCLYLAAQKIAPILAVSCNCLFDWYVFGNAEETIRGNKVYSKSFFWLFLDRVHKVAQKKTNEARSIKAFLYGSGGNFSCGAQRVIMRGQDSSILPARVTNHSAGFCSTCVLA